MKIVGLITEYNPFHNGHLYHIKESLRVTGADAAVVVMSGEAGNTCNHAEKDTCRDGTDVWCWSCL